MVEDVEGVEMVGPHGLPEGEGLDVELVNIFEPWPGTAGVARGITRHRPCGQHGDALALRAETLKAGAEVSAPSTGLGYHRATGNV